MERSLKEIPFDGPTLGMIEGLAGALLFIAILHGIGGALFLMFSLIAVCSGVGMAFAGNLAFAAVFGIVASLMYAFMGAIFLYQAKLLFDARSNLSGVINSDDADQQFTAQALGNLKTFFLIEAIGAGFGLLGALINIVQVILA